jgi:hypothetical protein
MTKYRHIRTGKLFNPDKDVMIDPNYWIKVTEKKKKPHFMRIEKDVLKDLDNCKIAKRESYAEVVKRLIEKERRLKR